MNEHLATAQPVTIGWAEHVVLHGTGLPPIDAKMDTGAASSSLHATGIQEIEDGRVRFTAHPTADHTDAVILERPIHDRRTVRSSTGHTTDRIVILLDLELAGRTITAETTLADRGTMTMRMLIGRNALQQGFLVDAGRSHVHGPAGIRA